MTKQQALYIFRKDHQGVVHGDVTYTRENWNNFTDDLCKSGEITTKQYETWTNPF
jgi:polyhydroxyalkanoate synthesis regulator phasin